MDGARKTPPAHQEESRDPRTEIAGSVSKTSPRQTNVASSELYSPRKIGLLVREGGLHDDARTCVHDCGISQTVAATNDYYQHNHKRKYKTGQIIPAVDLTQDQSGARRRSRRLVHTRTRRLSDDAGVELEDYEWCACASESSSCYQRGVTRTRTATRTTGSDGLGLVLHPVSLRV